MLPVEKKGAVTRALHESFGVDDFEDIERLTKGLTSALVFRIVVTGRPYLLRIITRSDALGDPTRQFAIMKTVAEAGLAPRVRYTSIEDRVSISDFVEAVPLAMDQARILLPRALRKLHALPPFAKPAMGNYLDLMDGLICRFEAAGILPESETREVFWRYRKLASACPREGADMVSCHNDLKPENILFDGDRVWLVDWEAAFLNDRYVDISMAANFILRSDAEEEVFLHEYFGEPAGEYRAARFFAMRQIGHMAYSAMFLLLGLAGQPLNPAVKSPDFDEFHDRIWAGDVDLADGRMKVLYGLSHRARFVENMQSPRFNETLRITQSGQQG